MISRTIEVFADVWCPFTHVGLRMIASLRDAAGRNDVAIVVRSWPLELVNGAPLGVEKTAGNIDALRAQLSSDMFAGFDPARFPTTTLPALDLVARAYSVSTEIGERLSFAVRDALFEVGEDIGSEEVLRRIAADTGIDFEMEPDHELVHRDWEEGRRRGVIGSPHFFCGDENVFCPSLRLSRDEDSRLHVVADAERLRDFVSHCLSD